MWAGDCFIWFQYVEVAWSLKPWSINQWLILWTVCKPKNIGAGMFFWMDQHWNLPFSFTVFRINLSTSYLDSCVSHLWLALTGRCLVLRVKHWSAGILNNQKLVLIQIKIYLNVQCLILSRNKISDWPCAILKSLPNLICLKLDNNALTQVKGF